MRVDAQIGARHNAAVAGKVEDAEQGFGQLQQVAEAVEAEVDQVLGQIHDLKTGIKKKYI